jgi:hypothetical protein
VLFQPLSFFDNADVIIRIVGYGVLKELQQFQITILNFVKANIYCMARFSKYKYLCQSGHDDDMAFLDPCQSCQLGFVSAFPAFAF